MSGFGWNLRHGSRGTPQRVHLPSQIACRICDQVFVSTQALISHTEAHMAEEGSSLRTRRELGRNPIAMSSPPGDSFTYPFHLNNLLPQLQPFQDGLNVLPLQERNPVFGTPFSQPRSNPQLQVPLVPNNNHRAVVGSPQQQLPFTRHTQPLVGDCTKPFLQQLEKPLPLKLDNKTASRVEILDLTLKL